MLHPSQTATDPSYSIAELHRIQTPGKGYILCVSNSALFQIGEITSAIIDAARERNPITHSQLMTMMEGKWPAEDVEEGLLELRNVSLVQPVDNTAGPTFRETESPFNQPVSTLVGIFSKSCNLACSYCYAQQGSYDGNKGQMEEKVAFKAVDFLIERCGKNKDVHLTFFGGEPLLNFPVIRSTVLYGRKRASEAGKRIHFSITTNATLLTTEIIEFLHNQRIGITVSIDGPREIHDLARRSPDGTGSYEIVRSKISELVHFYRGIPIGARVTVTRKAINIKDIFFHLFEMGFHEVGFSPVSTADKEYSLSQEDLEVFTQQFKELSDLYVEKAINGEYLGFSNLSNILKQIHQGTSKPYPCGGGIGFMGMDANGDLYVCHRLVGKTEFSLGNLWEGIDAEKQKRFLSDAHLNRKKQCQQCWARYLCGGGCYHESFVHYGTVAQPPSHFCPWLKQWVEIGVATYVRILEKNPEFVKRVVEGSLIC